MTQLATLSLTFAAATDIGCRRANNEDSFGYSTDAVGGALAGEVASNTAVRTFIESFETQARERESPMESRLLHSIEEANRTVRDLSTINEQFSHMGTTLVCAGVAGARAVIGNVGDSRAYLIRGGACIQMTQDHSLVEEGLQNGLLTPEMAENSSLRSVITRAIGMADTVQPDFFVATLQAEDMLLLASDGLTRYLTPSEIASIALAGVELPVICKEFVECAKQRGGADNITCILLRAKMGPGTGSS
jgi:serine/threonine protein phosphatase PrpC